MSGTTALKMGDRGRLVIPVDVRQRFNLSAGTPLVLLETPSGLAILTQDQLKARVRADYQTDSGDLVGELLAERRAAALLEEAR
ncbi:MAG: AbrB/MazE/SpoVT family DNA-binding domain-containing protein [Propionibacteriaceae bacterium]|jgi:AbrB family looped-hinge helix DNA binding protein|nr:AbrB/MazE/SpoVT family DNA-binding domain-containing protein [Propionibacteriaceae bacterium]